MSATSTLPNYCGMCGQPYHFSCPMLQEDGTLSDSGTAETNILEAQDPEWASGGVKLEQPWSQESAVENFEPVVPQQEQGLPAAPEAPEAPNEAGYQQKREPEQGSYSLVTVRLHFRSVGRREMLTVLRRTRSCRWWSVPTSVCVSKKESC